jgi:hypothetical protein
VANKRKHSGTSAFGTSVNITSGQNLYRKLREKIYFSPASFYIFRPMKLGFALNNNIANRLTDRKKNDLSMPPQIFCYPERNGYLAKREKIC